MIKMTYNVLYLNRFLVFLNEFLNVYIKRKLQLPLMERYMFVLQNFRSIPDESYSRQYFILTDEPG